MPAGAERPAPPAFTDAQILDAARRCGPTAIRAALRILEELAEHPPPKEPSR